MTCCHFGRCSCSTDCYYWTWPLDFTSILVKIHWILTSGTDTSSWKWRKSFKTEKLLPALYEPSLGKFMLSIQTFHELQGNLQKYLTKIDLEDKIYNPDNHLAPRSYLLYNFCPSSSFPVHLSSTSAWYLFFQKWPMIFSKASVAHFCLALNCCFYFRQGLCAQTLV